jgi:hypothetical protein
MFFEKLESRQLFSVWGGGFGGIFNPPGGGTMSPGHDEMLDPGVTKRVGDTLVVNGDGNANTLEVRPGRIGFVEVFRDGQFNGRFARKQIKRISMVGFDGWDTLKVDARISLPSYIHGGVGNDEIQGGNASDTLDGGAGNDTVRGGFGNDTVTGADGDDSLFGEAGDDSITGNNGNDWVHGGDGNDVLKGDADDDSVFGGAGNDKMYGGDHDDILVSVFGGKHDTVSGDGGWDNFVADSDATEKLYDADALSTARKSVNRISRFSNPTKMGSNPVYATELLGENIDDPKLTSTATGYANFDYVELFAPGNRPRTEDVQQDRYGLNDCWLAASSAAIARSKEWVIRRAVMPLGDGTYMVKLNGRCYRLDAELPVNARGAAYGDPFATPEGALWFPLVEKAMAYAMWTGGTQYKYGDVESDTPGTAYNALGLSYDRYTLAEVPVLGIGTSTDEMFSYIKSNLSKAITITTEPGWLGVGSKLRSSHAYTVIDAWVDASGKKLVKLRNPYADNLANGNEVTVGAGNLHDSCLLLYIGK